jgi:signal transduction histidine kinase
VRRRLLVLSFVLLSALLTALLVPLAQSYTTARSQRLYIDRLGDTSRFAALAEPVLTSRRTTVLRAELIRYRELYGVSVAVVDPDGRVFLASSPGHEVLAADGVRDALDSALAGRPAQRVPDAWPWQRQDYVIAEPVGRGSLVLGAVVTVSPTDPARADVARRLLLLLLAGLAAMLAAAVLVSLPLVRWILRPVHDLDATAQKLRQGHLQARAPVDEGPPELRGLAASFNAMAAGVQAALDQQRAFVADASHQLRNPLTALRLRVEQLAEHGPATVATAALRETDRLAATVDGLLHLARAEATRAERRPVDLAAVATARLRDWQSRLPQARSTVVGPAVAVAVPGVAEEIMDVLLDNVAKYAPGAAVTVIVGGPTPDGRVELEVRDGGPGLPELPAEELARLGERFYRAPTHRGVPGTGLGLSIARTLAQAADGELVIEPGPGFTVRLRLPSAGTVGGSG